MYGRFRFARLGDKFVEVYMKIPLEVCEQRDPKGLYKAARAGKIKGFTGIDDPYEEPLDAEIVMEVAKEGGDGSWRRRRRWRRRSSRSSSRREPCSA